MKSLAIVLFAVIINSVVSSESGYQNAAQMLEDAIDESVDPCNDWFQFSCGNWIKNNPIPPGYSSSSPMGNQGIVVDKQLKEIFTDIKFETSIPTVQQAKIYRDLCQTNISPSAADIQDYFVRIYKKIERYGGWPLLRSEWNGPVGGSGLGSSSALMGHLLGHFGVRTFIHTAIDPDWKNPAKWACVLHDGSHVQATEQSIIDLIDRMSASVMITDLNRNRVQRQVKDLLDLEKKLYEISRDRPSLDNITEAFYYTKDFDLAYNSFSLGQLQQRWWFIDWLELFKAMARDNVPLSQLTTSSYVVPFPEILDKLRDIFILSSDETIQNFLIWRFVNKYSHLLPADANLERPNSRICAATENTLSNAVSRPFIEQWGKIISKQSMKDLDDMVILILDALRAMFGTLKWMTPDSLKQADAKLDSMGRNIGHPSWILNDTTLNKIFNRLDLSSSDDPLRFAFKLDRFQAWSQVSKINAPADFGLFNFQNHYLYTTNAWYQPWYNSITIPAAIVQDPMFHEGWPKAVGFGMIGGVLGHEITHGFDTTGVQWDSHGAKNYWMDQKSSQGFNKMAQCVIDQYSDICYPNLTNGDMRQGKCIKDRECTCVNGKSTKAEDIADVGGTLAAYLAYKKFVSLHGEEERLPGKMSKYSMEQIFFMSYALSWCSNDTPASLKRAAEAVSDLRGHSPEPIRGVEPLKDITAFAQTFKCPVGKSAMAPESHCKVWIGEDLPNDFMF